MATPSNPYSYNEMANKVIQSNKRGNREETSALSMAGRIQVKDMGTNYRPQENTKRIKQDTINDNQPDENLYDQLYEAFLTKIRNFLPDSSHDVIKSASDLAIEILSLEDSNVTQKRSELEELLSTKVDDIDLNDLVGLANQMNKLKVVHEGNGNEDDTEFVAVNFDTSDEENQEEDLYENEIEEEVEEVGEIEKGEEISEVENEIGEEEEDNIEYDTTWIESEISDIVNTHSLSSPRDELISKTFDLLSNTKLTVEDLDDDLNKLFDFHASEFVIKLIENRWRLVYMDKLAKASNAEDKEEIFKEMTKQKLDSLIEDLKGSKKRPADDREHTSTKRSKPSKKKPQRISLEKILFSTSLESTKITLPKGTYQTNKKSYDIITVPAIEKPLTEEDVLLPTSVLPEWARDAFPSNETTTFNRIQSKIYPQAFETNNNLLICAPTGAGKTNVAMLTMLGTISKFRNQHGHIQLKNFKIVYIAPLKALVQEQMREFSRRLTSTFGLVVNELTGDSTLSKQQIIETQVIVTTPEKWDIITRKDPSYAQLVRLIIIDEIHLLHDERGPVLESIVSRTLRKVETTGMEVRLVGLSATLPNYRDVAKFIRVNIDEGLFYFDASYRPCPLQQEYVGIKEKKAIKKLTAMNEACYDRMYDSLTRGHQLIIFVHSRKETHTTAKYLMEKLSQQEEFQMIENLGTKEILAQESESSTNRNLKEVLSQGFGIHHAGLNKKDRSTVEDLFAQGLIRVLVSTATLAWGVNLPAHTVIIKGTETYSPELGTWVQLSPQDILQMLGRAGRPRYDKNGEGIIITSQDQIQYYLGILNQQLPIESKLIEKLVDSVNAEVVSGSITTLEEGIEWLSYTYFFVRMLHSPSLYGVEAGYDFKHDPALHKRRADLIYTALSILHENRLVIYDPVSGEVKSTELGKVAAYYYINYETINMYGKMLKPWHNETDILRVFANSGEFKYIPVRAEERLEISKLMEKCPIPIKEQAHEVVAKINVLLQTYISRLSLEGYALISDMIYITQSASRLLRALYEIAVLKKWSSLSKSLLDICKMVENRMWLNNSPLRQFGSLVPNQIIKATEMSHLPWIRYFSLSSEELAEAVNLKGNAKLVNEYVMSFPRITTQYHVQPISSDFLRIQIEVIPVWSWISSVQGNQETFVVMLEDCNGLELLHYEIFQVHRANVGKPHIVEFYIPVSDPLPPNYILSFISHKWVQCTWKTPIVLTDIQLPSSTEYYLDNSSVDLIPTSELNYEDFAGIFEFETFNRLQSAVFDSIYNITNENVFIGASKGDGKTTCCELAILAAWREQSGRVVYINPNQDIIDKNLKKWQKLFSGYSIEKLNGTLKDDIQVINSNQLILATPGQFTNLSKRWKTKKSFKSIGLFIFDNLHLISSEPRYEILISRIRLFTSQWEDDQKVRIVGLSHPVATCRDLADWIGVSKKFIYNFPPQARENKIQEIKISSDESISNVKIYKELKNVSSLKNSILFTSTRSAAIALAKDLVEFMHTQEWRRIDLGNLSKYISRVQDPILTQFIEYGIGLYYAGMSRIDRIIVEKLFETNSIGVLIATSDTCAFSPRADNILVVGTTYYEGSELRNVSYQVQTMFEMIGNCKNGGRVHIYTNTIDFYSGFINSGLVVESGLLGNLHDYLIGGIVNGVVKSRQDCIDLITFSYFYSRLLKNPNFYDLKTGTSLGVSEYLSELIENTLEELVKGEFIEDDEEAEEISGLNRCLISLHYQVSFETIRQFSQIGRKSKIKDIFQILASASEFETLPIRKDEVQLLEKLGEKLPIKYHGEMNATTLKVFILLQAHISRIELPFDLKHDQKVVISKILDILYACIDTLSSEGYLNALLLMDLSQMIVQAVWNNSTAALKQIPYFSGDILERCKKSKVETVYDIMSLEDDERNDILQLDEDSDELKMIAEFVNQYPNIEISYELAKPISTNESNEVKIVIERDEEMDSIDVVSQYYPGKKEEGWWIVVGDANIRQLYAIKKISIPHEKQEFTIEFNVSNQEAETMNKVSVWCVCDSYIDADKEISLS
ncbi:brr2 [[Candida] subhashii]|uniref:Brr2 n=1 Tax=[Candida] subhashii TaxID=561895 RepID=A0A8J5QGG6_9ASCO|nr:brr2 [[Candida] subhashii]KAG7661704.1 brr2 [[Candida] subhashii]